MPRKTRSKTLLEDRYPATDDQLTRLAAEWVPRASQVILHAILSGLQLVNEEVVQGVNIGQSDENLERQLTQLLTPRIRRSLTGDESYDVEHQVSEEATRRPPPAQPPTPDIGFSFHDNPRVIWSVEGKVLRTDAAVAEYVADVRANFLTGRYSPYSSEGAMVGFLLMGIPAKAVAAIGVALPAKMNEVINEPHRSHAWSQHVREIPRGRSFARDFKCHHLVYLIVK